MSAHAWVDELIDFLLERLDDEGVAVLEGHLPRRVSVEYYRPQANQLGACAVLWGCEVCWTKPGEWRPCPEERWPCASVRALTLPFADDPDYRERWRPDHRDLWLPYYRDRERGQE
ncbi:hypothetical protein [Streptomyces sp. NPDC101150]|uniref:hypothetical protein n=1 Tax=Streptomyces sp. NPDC101150 TaxID=3366114 RepID=UPI0038052E6B